MGFRNVYIYIGNQKRCFPKVKKMSEIKTLDKRLEVGNGGKVTGTQSREGALGASKNLSLETVNRGHGTGAALVISLEFFS